MLVSQGKINSLKNEPKPTVTTVCFWQVCGARVKISLKAYRVRNAFSLWF